MSPKQALISELRLQISIKDTEKMNKIYKITCWWMFMQNKLAEKYKHH